MSVDGVVLVGLNGGTSVRGRSVAALGNSSRHASALSPVLQALHPEPCGLIRPQLDSGRENWRQGCEEH